MLTVYKLVKYFNRVPMHSARSDFFTGELADSKIIVQD